MSYFDFVVVDARNPLIMYHNKELFPLYRREKIRKTGCPTLILLLLMLESIYSCTIIKSCFPCTGEER